MAYVYTCWLLGSYYSTIKPNKYILFPRAVTQQLKNVAGRRFAQGSGPEPSRPLGRGPAGWVQLRPTLGPTKVQIYMCVYTFIIYMYRCTHIYTCMCTYVYIYIYIYIHSYTYIYIYIHTCICMSTSVYIHMFDLLLAIWGYSEAPKYQIEGIIWSFYTRNCDFDVG